ncbi:MAG: hypothetical protein WDZ93_00240 [Candidatus Paceibacterota bacterium]
MNNARTILNTFKPEELPNLDAAVFGALELFEEKPPCQAIPIEWDRILVVGSGNARATGEILFADMDAIYADESSIEQVLASHTGIGGAVLISASGGKHAVPIAQTLAKRKIPTVLLTNNPKPRAQEHLHEGKVVVFPKNREPYTYNTSTYLGMILSHTEENAGDIRKHIETVVAKIEENDFKRWNAYTFIIPKECQALTGMFRTKFDELFGPFIQGRAFTDEEIKHAKTVVTSPKECFISFGVKNDVYGVEGNRIAVPLPEEAGHGALMAIGYFVIGAIQKQLPPYFKNNIDEYAKRMTELLKEPIRPIVE